MTSPLPPGGALSVVIDPALEVPHGPYPQGLLRQMAEQAVAAMLDAGTLTADRPLVVTVDRAAPRGHDGAELGGFVPAFGDSPESITIHTGHFQGNEVPVAREIAATLVHELVHARQEREGRFRRTRAERLGVSYESDPKEIEAHRMEWAALQALAPRTTALQMGGGMRGMRIARTMPGVVPVVPDDESVRLEPTDAERAEMARRLAGLAPLLDAAERAETGRGLDEPAAEMLQLTRDEQEALDFLTERRSGSALPVATWMNNLDPAECEAAAARLRQAAGLPAEPLLQRAVARLAMTLQERRLAATLAGNHGPTHPHPATPDGDRTRRWMNDVVQMHPDLGRAMAAGRMDDDAWLDAVISQVRDATGAGRERLAGDLLTTVDRHRYDQTGGVQRLAARLAEEERAQLRARLRSPERPSTTRAGADAPSLAPVDVGAAERSVTLTEGEGTRALSPSLAASQIRLFDVLDRAEARGASQVVPSVLVPRAPAPAAGTPSTAPLRR